MKRDPGEWLEKRLLERAFQAVLLAVLGLGWLFGGGLALWLTHGTSIALSWAGCIVLLPVAGLLGAALYKEKRGLRWSRFVGQSEGENKVYSDCVDALDEGTLPAQADDVNGIVEAPAVVV